MRQEISNDVQIGSSLMPFQSVRKFLVIDKASSDFDNANLKVKKIRRLLERGIYDADNAQYIPGTLNIASKG